MKEAKEVKIRLSKRKVMLTIVLVFVIILIVLTSKLIGFITKDREISNLGKPSILVPLPDVSQDHQLYNAKVLENVGAAKIILNNELTKDNLNNEIQNIIKNADLMKQMGEKALSKSVKNVQEKIYREINKVIKGC